MSIFVEAEYLCLAPKNLFVAQLTMLSRVTCEDRISQISMRSRWRCNRSGWWRRRRNGRSCRQRNGGRGGRRLR
ncbi:hypothetical protein QVD17_04138 [Tagetes erecta]|uniref:Uncharacterized protein n=1 Tax=Tagetes erecta TaxID=13708 RepID=A0AAD8PAH1_TARER|nr:hypothetical protein QVD17_04138 [Tagetes erecta]